jgi:GGDEF domain-containing protein
VRRLVESVPAVDLASPPRRRRARDAFQSDRLLTWTAICAAGYVVAFLAGTLVFAEGTRPAVALTDLVYPVPEAIAAALLYVAGRRSRRAPWFWYLASLSMLCGLAGDVNWAVYDLLLGAPPTPSVGDIGYMAQPVLLVGALIASYPVVRPRPGDVADLAIPFTAVLFGVLELVIEPQVAGGLTAATLPSVAETLITIVAALVFTSIVAGHRGLPASVRLLYAGVLAAAVSYPVYAYAISLSGWQHTNWIYTGFEVMFVLSGLAGLVRIRRGEPSRIPTHVANDVNVWMITAGLALVLAVTGLTMHDGRMDAEAPWVALGAITVVLVRMHQIVRQRGRLAVELRRSADQLARSLSAQQRLATTDSLTKIANRRAFDERLRAAIDAAGEPGGSVGLLVLDLDHFKLVNDRYGHPTGDQVLQSVARRIRRVIRTQDTLARIGGEEFAVVVPAAAAGELVELPIAAGWTSPRTRSPSPAGGSRSRRRSARRTTRPTPRAVRCSCRLRTAPSTRRSGRAETACTRAVTGNATSRLRRSRCPRSHSWSGSPTSSRTSITGAPEPGPCAS